jgi:hypothetical protein
MIVLAYLMVSVCVGGLLAIFSHTMMQPANVLENWIFGAALVVVILLCGKAWGMAADEVGEL